MNSFNLHRFIFPNPNICDVKEMFVRGGARYDFLNQMLICDTPSHIDFHTYFNLIPAKHFNEYLGVNHIDLAAKFKGSAEFSLYANSPGISEPQLISQIVIDSNSMDDEVEIFNFVDISKVFGYIYLVVNTHSDSFNLKDVYVRCLSDREPAKVGIVTCTFKRENEVLRTIDCIREEFINDKFSLKNTELFIIDNDQKQKLTIQETNKIHHISNKNLGGAGGFTRGILETIDANKDYVLLCDDDILAFGEVFRRTVVVLSLMLDPKKGVHGCMLEEESKFTLHEVGEYFDINKRMHINPHYGKNMTDFGMLKEIAFESRGTSKSSNMFGWWFTAFPKSIFKEIGFPMPLFVSGDDLEYGLRAVKNGYSAFISPSISVWHPSHMTQHAPLRNYFITRNRFAYYPVHASEKQLKNLFDKTIDRAYKQLLSKRYATAESTILALEDFLRGPEWFNEDLGDWINRLKFNSEEKTQKLYTNKWLVPTEYRHIKPADNSLKNKVLSKLTFNGHVLSTLFQNKIEDPSSQYHVCIPFGVNPHGKDITKIAFRSSSILYFDPRFSVGYRVEHNSKKFWVLYTKLLKLRIKGKDKIPGLFKIYRDEFDKATTQSWWKKRLQMD